MWDGERIDVNDQTLPYAVPATQQSPNLVRQIFGLIVRTLGLLLAVYGLSMLLIAITAKIGMTYDGSLTPDAYFVHAVFWVGIGVALLRCEWLLRFAYGREA